MDSDTSTPRAAIRYCCPYPGCSRSFRDFWRLKVHYRALPGARGSGVERGHGQELPHCPLCLARLDDVKYHKCSAGPAAHASGQRKTSSGNSQGQAPAAAAAVSSGLISSGSVNQVAAVRPTITWPQHLSVSTSGPAQLQSYGSNGVNMMGQGQLVTTTSYQHSQQPMQQQQQQQQVMVQSAMQPQPQQIQQQQQQIHQQHSQQLQLPAKQLWVQTNAAAGPSSSTGMVMQTQNGYQQQQQYSQQQQQVTWSIQQVPAGNGHYAQANSVPQQQTWQTQLQQQQAPAPVQHYNAAAATAAMQHSQQQQQQLQPLQIATQLLAPALGQLQYQQQPQQQQEQQLVYRHLSPVITLPSNHPANPANTVYRPSPRLSGDGCFSSFLLPRLSTDGGMGGQWTPSAVAAAAPGAVSAFAAAAASAFKQSASQPGTVSLQQQQQQQQGQSAWAQQMPQTQQQQMQQQQPVQQQQQLGSVSYFQAATGKVSNNSGSSSSGEWHPIPQSAVQQSGALSGLIQGFAAEMQARAYQQQQLQQQQDAAQQQSAMQQGASLVSASTAAAGYQSYGASAMQQTWLQQPGTAATPAAADFAAVTMAAAAPTVPAAAGALTATPGVAGADAAQGLICGMQLPEFALRIADEFKASLGALRHSMVYTDSLQQPEARVQQEPGQAVRVGSSSGSTSPGSSSDGKGLLPGSCESVLYAAQQQQQQQQGSAAAAVADVAATEADVSPGGQGIKRPADDSTAAAAVASPEEGAEQQAKKQKLSPARSASAQLPPLGNGAIARLAGAASGSPPRPTGTSTGPNGTPPRAPAAAGPFAAAAGGAGFCAEGSAQVHAVAVQRAPSATGLMRTCSVWSDTPPPPEASAALLELAAQMHKGSGGLPETADAAAQGAGSWQQQQGGEVSAAAAAALAAAAQQLLTLPVPGSDDQCGSQKHRALVAGLMKKATDDARACGLADPSLLVTQLMSILDDHVAALSQLGNPGTQLGVASAGGWTVELPTAPSVGGTPDGSAAVATAEQCGHSAAAAGLGFAAPAAVAAVPQG